MAVALLWGLAGLIGIVYTIVVGRRLRTQTQYKLVFEDWLRSDSGPWSTHES